jgi:membrane-associated phospholipid phosphatase
MICDFPLTSASPAECYTYRPGVWSQDIFTIPAELALVAAVSAIKPPQRPLWPFENEKTDAPQNPTRHPGVLAAGLALSAGVPLLVAASRENPELPLGHYLRGLVHSILWTEISTSTAKNTFGRRRPFFDTAIQRGDVAVDHRRSFFSGHSSHAFAFSTYSTRFAFDMLKDRSATWIFASVLQGTALWIASSRAVDRQHHPSDVVVGSLVGAAFGYFMYERVHALRQLSTTVSFSPNSITLSYSIK